MMKRLFLRVFPVLLVLVFSGSVSGSGLRAQNTVGFSSLGFTGMPDTVYSGLTIPVGAFVKNYSPVLTYNDSIQIVGYLDTGSVYIPFSIPAYDTILLPPGDSAFVIIPVDFRDTYMGGQFRIGNNVIVVWPSLYGSGFTTGDSLTANVFVIDTISSVPPDPRNDEMVRCFPVPAIGPLYITSSNPSIRVKSALIRNASGQTIAVSHDLSAGVDTQPWAPGVYFIEVTFDNGMRRTYKVMKQ